MRAFLSESEQQTEEFALALAEELRSGDVLAMRGGMGAGKTAFVRGLARGLGITAAVSSPTYALVHEYRAGDRVLYHFDMYRVTDADSLETTGYFEALEQSAVLCVEWSENIAWAIPKHAVTITMRPEGENSRHITVEGERF